MSQQLQHVWYHWKWLSLNALQLTVFKHDTKSIIRISRSVLIIKFVMKAYIVILILKIQLCSLQNHHYLKHTNAQHQT